MRRPARRARLHAGLAAEHRQRLGLETILGVLREEPVVAAWNGEGETGLGLGTVHRYIYREEIYTLLFLCVCAYIHAYTQTLVFIFKRHAYIYICK